MSVPRHWLDRLLAEVTASSVDFVAQRRSDPHDVSLRAADDAPSSAAMRPGFARTTTRPSSLDGGSEQQPLARFTDDASPPSKSPPLLDPTATSAVPGAQRDVGMVQSTLGLRKRPVTARAAATFSSLPSTSKLGPRSHARRRALSLLAARGLAFGTPFLRSDQRPSRALDELEPLVRLLAVVSDVVADAVPLPMRAGLETSSPATTKAQLHRALAIACVVVWGNFPSDDVRSLFDPDPARASTSLRKKLSLLERELPRRRYLLGNPLLGVNVHRAFVAMDARALVWVAMDVVAGVVVDADTLRWMRQRLVRERRSVTAAIGGLSQWRESIDVETLQAASVWQVEHLGLPQDEAARLLEVVQRPPALSRLLTMVPVDARGRVFLQTALVAVMDGRVTAAELRYLAALGDLLGLPPRSQARTRRRVVSFAEQNPDAFNPLADAAGFAAADPPLSMRLARVVFENADALWTEVRETGDLGVLLARRASGQSLTDEEQRRMRAQLIDVAKAVPALTMIALPGSFLLLPLLFKVLPFDLRTSAFRTLDDFRAFARDDDDSVTPQERGAREQRLLGPSAKGRS
jgi:hypothetical protein